MVRHPAERAACAARAARIGHLAETEPMTMSQVGYFGLTAVGEVVERFNQDVGVDTKWSRVTKYTDEVKADVSCLEFSHLTTDLHGAEDASLGGGELLALNPEFANLERALILLLGPMTLNSANGGRAIGEYVPPQRYQDIRHEVCF